MESQSWIQQFISKFHTTGASLSKSGAKPVTTASPKLTRFTTGPRAPPASKSTMTKSMTMSSITTAPATKKPAAPSSRPTSATSKPPVSSLWARKFKKVQAKKS